MNWSVDDLMILFRKDDESINMLSKFLVYNYENAQGAKFFSKNILYIRKLKV